MKFIDFPKLLAWILSLPVTFFVFRLVNKFSSSYFEIVLIMMFIHVIITIFFWYLQGKVIKLLNSRRFDLGIISALFILLSFFILNTIKTAEQFPSLFNHALFQTKTGQVSSLMIASIPAYALFIWLSSFITKKKWGESRIYKLLSRNLPGLLVAVLFFIEYLILASIFNRPAFDVDDIFFDTDGANWRTRFVTPAYPDYYWRSVHPYVLLIIRPLITLIAVVFNGNKLFAAFLLIALSGSICVFLTWYFIKHTVGNSLYSLLIASLLGASAAHLVFSSLIETYIFLAATAMTFLILILKDKPFFMLLLAGAVSFGITITNFAQTAIVFIFYKRDVKRWIQYGLIVAALTFPLTLLNNFVYPDSQPYFFIPSSLNAESGNAFTPTIERASAIARVMFFHSIVAPDPLVFKAEIPFLKVWMSKVDPISLSKYRTGLGQMVAYYWLGLILFGGYLFLKNIKRNDNRFPLAFICILFFNFCLHMVYGKDFFLYSANWTYAIILFLALAWKEVADKKWFQIVLLIFLGLLLANNSRLIFTMLSTSAMHIK